MKSSKVTAYTRLLWKYIARYDLIFLLASTARVNELPLFWMFVRNRRLIFYVFFTVHRDERQHSINGPLFLWALTVMYCEQSLFDAPRSQAKNRNELE